MPAHQAFPVALEDARLAAFVEPMSIAVRTVVRGRVEADEHVLVLGAGPIGQAVAIAALDRGAKVLLVDRVARRLERSASGADLAVAGEGDDLEAGTREWTGGELPEVVVEATGAKEPMRLALDLVAAAGRIVVVGLSGHDVPFRVGALPFRELDVLGVSCCQAHEFAAAAELVTRHRDAVAPLLTHEFSLEEAPQAIAFAIKHPADVMKAVVHVNVIAPGPIKTRIAGGVTPEGERQWAALVPLGRMGEPDELKGLALLLASPASSTASAWESSLQLRRSQSA